MDRRLKDYYTAELRHLREMGAEFAGEFPHIAKRLSLDDFDCQDPYVERLLEGFAFLSARIQLKMEAEFPRLTEGLLETVYPHYLAPTPSMTIVQFQPDLKEGSLAGGFLIPRTTVLRTNATSTAGTPCEYRTSHDVTLWPIEVIDAEYHTRDLASLSLPPGTKAKAVLRIRLKTTAGVPFSAMPLNLLDIYFRGAGEIPGLIYEQVFGKAQDLLIRDDKRGSAFDIIPNARWRSTLGFDDDQSLLPYDDRSFQGYRLLKEYFSLPERFQFLRMQGLRPSLAKISGQRADLLILFSAGDLRLEGAITAENIALFSTPAINLFPREADRIHLNRSSFEHHVIPDRTRPVDYEIYQLNSVVAMGTSAREQQEFRPFYAARDSGSNGIGGGAYYSAHRVPRTQTEKERRTGRRSNYPGSEMYISLVDSENAPYRSDLRQLAISTLCTNRDLPLHMALGTRDTSDFSLDIGGPVQSTRCLISPTAPRPSLAETDSSWRLVSHLCLNYLSLSDTDDRTGAAALRDILRLYADLGEPHIRKQVDGVRSVSTQPITRRVPTPGPIVFARGLEVSLHLDETAFEGSSVFLLGSVLEQFFTRYVSINSFTQTVLRTPGRGEIMRWPIKMGSQNVL